MAHFNSAIASKIFGELTEGTHERVAQVICVTKISRKGSGNNLHHLPIFGGIKLIGEVRGGKVNRLTVECGSRTVRNSLHKFRPHRAESIRIGLDGSAVALEIPAHSTDKDFSSYHLYTDIAAEELGNPKHTPRGVYFWAIINMNFYAELEVHLNRTTGPIWGIGGLL